MWPFRKRPQPVQVESVTAESDHERLDDLEDSVAHLGRRFTRLQQQVTRWSREYDLVEDEEQEDDFEQLLEERRRTNA